MAGGVAQVGREPPFERVDRPRDEEVQDEIDRAGDDEDLDGAEGLRDELLGDAGDLHHRDDRGKRRRLHHQDDLVAVGRQRLAHGDREDDAAEQQEARHAAGARGLDLRVRHRLQAAAE